jgi:hypothetical protein
MSSARTSAYLDTSGERPQVTRTLNSTSKYTILEQGREPGKDQWYAHCLYEDHTTDVTVIIDGEVLRHFEQQGVSSFSAIIEAALDAAQEVDWHPKQVAILLDTPILETMVASLQPDSPNHGQDRASRMSAEESP